MTNDNRTSDDIERDIADERAQMSDTINDLQKKFSVDAIVSDIGAMFRGQGDIVRSISDTVGRNPAAVALVGVGLAWMFLGQNRGTAAPQTKRSSDNVSRRSNSPASDPWDTASKGRRGNRPFRDHDSAWFGDDPMPGDRRSDEHDLKNWAENRSRTENEPSGVMGAIRDAATTAGDAISDAAGSASHAAANLTARLSGGLDDLSADAKARVVAARRAAHDARLASVAATKTGSRAATGFFEDQPLVVGALAVALGAAIGGVLPHTKIEDDTMGDSSDQLFADAQALLRHERDKAMATARTAATDVKDELRDVGEDLADLLPEGKSVGNVIVDRAADAATRVLSHATGSAVPKDDAPKT
jgi:hypothetical protein